LSKNVIKSSKFKKNVKIINLFFYGQMVEVNLLIELNKLNIS
jgi:hypothetical protein